MFIELKRCPPWALLSLAANGFMIVTLTWVLLAEYHQSKSDPVSHPVVTTRILNPTPEPVIELGPRHQLNYQQWLALLEKEAQVVANQQPEQLTVLLGDSLSLWFPNKLLPPKRYWLNQGLSGETSAGLLKRLDILDQTKPEAIFVMIGINDLIRGVKDEAILKNQRLTIRYLRRAHTETKIVLQSILPHGAEQATWEGRDRLLTIPNSRIQNLNQQLKAIAHEEGAIYLNLYPLFADNQGNLQPELSTDGLHLSPQGYLVWRYGLQIFEQLILQEGVGIPIAKGTGSRE
ncbi:GDSL-type esterase/lipase family protein [Moorena sp. SIO3H5]|uniref:GDSL-type esterase/lipase family protein n=1 Tax=Moorena sp. SIO3H5 TaxID=2607834 RepID=UPI0013BB56D6|nr:GDSL-type esterase/lipase family protein [Moorena sp. SIO3H5]NEO71476.1 lysophospholipase [Moorena sp. SIO3H5]